MEEKNLIAEDAWNTCLDTLRAVIADPDSAPDLETIERLSAKLYKMARKRRRKKAGKQIGAAERRRRKEQSLFQYEQGRAQYDDPHFSHGLQP